MAKKRILCFGDSNTWGFTPITGERYGEDVRWTGRLAKNPEYVIIEEGLNGRTSAYPDYIAPWRTGTDYIEACVASHEPLDLLIVMLGTNDMKKYVCNCADASAKGVARLIRMGLNVAEKPFKVLMIAPPVISRKRLELEPPMLQLNMESLENSEKFAGLFKEQAELNGWYFLDAASIVTPSDKDAVHLEPEGHAALAAAIEEKLKEIFA